MTKLTWKGEDELHGPTHGGPNFMTWKDIKFPKGQAVEVKDPFIIGKARANQFFIVEGDKPAAPAPEPIQEMDDEPPVHTPKRGRPFQKRKVAYDADTE